MPQILDFNTQLRNCNLVSSQICPYCFKVIVPQVICSVANDNFSNLFLTLVCPGCENVYFEEFKKIIKTSYKNGAQSTSFHYQSAGVYPPPPVVVNFSETIQLKYLDFIEIYNQAATAESMNLNQICGMGYRKALESLAKQYALECFPDESTRINKETLSQTISRFESHKIKTLAKAATWLGNDHTHLIAKHPEYDLSQLKAFIRVLCQEIESEEEFKKAQDLISKSH